MDIPTSGRDGIEIEKNYNTWDRDWKKIYDAEPGGIGIEKKVYDSGPGLKSHPDLEHWVE